MQQPSASPVTAWEWQVWAADAEMDSEGDLRYQPASFRITVCPPETQTIDLEFYRLEKGVDDLINSQRLFHMKKPQGF